MVTGDFVILGLFHDLQQFLTVTGHELGMFLVPNQVIQGIGVFPVIIKFERRPVEVVLDPLGQSFGSDSAALAIAFQVSPLIDSFFEGGLAVMPPVPYKAVAFALQGAHGT